MSSPRTHRPVERFWPYVEKPEEPTADELAALDPELHAALFGRRDLPFSVTLVFPSFEGPDYARAVQQARSSCEYREVGQGESRRHRAALFSGEAAQLRDLYQYVRARPGCEVLIDDRPLPYSRELWLPLIWLMLLD